MAFDKKDHVMRVKGNEYLPVAGRVKWMRQDHPDWIISTSIELLDMENKVAVVKASISRPVEVMDDAGFSKGVQVIGVATGFKMEDVKGFPDWLEKAETGAIGRALARCGYGTEYDEDDHRPDAGNEAGVVDTPEPVRGKLSAPAPPAAPPARIRRKVEETEEEEEEEEEDVDPDEIDEEAEAKRLEVEGLKEELRQALDLKKSETKALYLEYSRLLDQDPKDPANLPTLAGLRRAVTLAKAENVKKTTNKAPIRTGIRR